MHILEILKALIVLIAGVSANVSFPLSSLVLYPSTKSFLFYDNELLLLKIYFQLPILKIETRIINYYRVNIESIILIWHWFIKIRLFTDMTKNTQV